MEFKASANLGCKCETQKNSKRNCLKRPELKAQRMAVQCALAAKKRKHTGKPKLGMIRKGTENKTAIPVPFTKDATFPHRQCCMS